jgi:DNA-binding XRE family transcriptional regulator
MLGHTKKHPTESIKFYGSPQAISRLRKYARTAGVVEASADSIPAAEIFPDLVTNPHGIYLKGSRYREDLTQVQLAEITGIPRRHISEMENGKRTIGKERAKKLAAALHVDYRMFL